MVGLLVTLALAVPRFEEAWLHRVATVAGFHVTGHNDAAWFVRGRGRTGFYLWANRGTCARCPIRRPCLTIFSACFLRWSW
jgi:hypothetical protein